MKKNGILIIVLLVSVICKFSYANKTAKDFIKKVEILQSKYLVSNQGKEEVEFDVRMFIQTHDSKKVQVQKIEITTPNGVLIDLKRTDVTEIDQIDPILGIEVIKGFEKEKPSSKIGNWNFGEVGAKDVSRFGDGFYTFTVIGDDFKESVKIWYGMPDGKTLIEFPDNKGLTSPDLSKELKSPLTYKWQSIPNTEYVAFFTRNNEKEGFETEKSFGPDVNEWGPHEYKAGNWGFEISYGNNYDGNVDGVSYNIIKQTCYAREMIIK